MTKSQDVADIIFMLREQDFDADTISEVHDILSDEFEE